MTGGPVPAPVGAAQVPEQVRAAAAAAPGQWISLVDPHWAGEGAPPPWAVVGSWRAGEAGVVEEFEPNEEYRPSPTAHGWPPPTDPVDAAVQLSATGYGPPEDVYRALAAGPLAVAADGDGGPGSVGLPDGQWVVPVFSDRSWLAAAGDPLHLVLGAAELADLLPPGHRIVLNPGAPVAMRLEPDLLRAAG
ncbi:type VII secretion system-associated protein [Kitasatospora sp. NPDC056446]|uniref:type VII secretion system-associated protein n=1 Tax=Kitasatospora sp. NPDC056446 TaxID=3345819 RepID=UPI0036896A72